MPVFRDNPYGAFNYIVALGGAQGDGSEGSVIGGFIGGCWVFPRNGPKRGDRIAACRKGCALIQSADSPRPPPNAVPPTRWPPDAAGCRRRRRAPT